MWRVPWNLSAQAHATIGAARLPLALAAALGTLHSIRPRSLGIACASLPVMWDLVCHFRGNARAFARSVTPHVAIILATLYATSHVVPIRLVGMVRGYWEAGHYWAPFTAQFVCRDGLVVASSIIVFLLFGVRVESLISARAFIGTILLTSIVLALQNAFVGPPVRIHAAAGICVSISAAWPFLLAIRPAWAQRGREANLADAFVIVCAMHLATIVFLVLSTSSRFALPALALAAICGIVVAVGSCVLQRWRTERILRAFRARKRERQRRWQNRTPAAGARS